MAFSQPVLLIFHGGSGDAPAERMMAAARVSAGRRSAAAALAAGFEAVIVATDTPAAFEPVQRGVLLDPDPPGLRYAFDQRLRDLVTRYGLQRPAVMGAGSVPLLGVADFQLVAEQLQSRDERFVTNNFFSADLTGWTPGSAVLRTAPFSRDNQLPRRLRDDAGLNPVLLPRTTETQFDLDTPADLAVLAVGEHLPTPRTPVLADHRLPLDAYRRVMRVLCDRTAELVVAGRTGPAAWLHLERETACRVRMFSEERGLATAPPEHHPRSLVGMLLEALGVERFFERLMELGDAFVIDTRVIEAHLGLTPTREERFQSDMLQFEAIEEPLLRQITRAAARAPRPVLLGGHSLVAGGLMALNDIAWRENDRLVAP